MNEETKPTEVKGDKVVETKTGELLAKVVDEVSKPTEKREATIEKIGPNEVTVKVEEKGKSSSTLKIAVIFVLVVALAAISFYLYKQLKKDEQS